MDIITIDGREQGRLMVADGRIKRAVLRWAAPGLHIYIIGIPTKMYAAAMNLAVNEAIARHIPAISLRRVEK